ncbi:hypothetical protein CI088_12115, partial [Enterococcus plantarum]
ENCSSNFCDQVGTVQHQLVPCCVLQQFRLISEGVASAPTVYSVTKSLKHNVFSYVPGSSFLFFIE